MSFSLGHPERLQAVLGDAGFRHVQIVSRSTDVQLRLPERFVQLTVAGAATSVSSFMRISPEARSALVEAIGAELERTIKSRTVGGELVLPMFANIALAQVTACLHRQGSGSLAPVSRMGPDGCAVSPSNLPTATCRSPASTHSGGRRRRFRLSTPHFFPMNRSHVNRRFPRLGRICRLARKALTRPQT